MATASEIPVERINYDEVTLEFEGPLATLTLNNPDRLNAMGPGMALEIASALNEVSKPRRRVRALYITGAGRAFCAGANLMGSRKAVSEGKGQVDALLGTETTFHPMLRRLHNLPIPVIAGVNGLAIGIGVGLALAADYVIASDAAYFLVPFKNLASAPDSGLTWLLPRAIGPARARRMLMGAERVEAETAEKWGMIAEIAAADDFAERARTVALEYANGPTIALGEIKNLLNGGLRTDLHSAFEAESMAVIRTSRTKDNVAAIRVFGSKEKPVFTGE